MKRFSIVENEVVAGFKVIKISEVPQLNLNCYQLEHVKTGAKILHIQADDDNNCASIAFKTIPTDSSGVAHILEHTALCGTEKYPVRDLFSALNRFSINNFVNAFTGPDCTMYPLCSQNKTDFFNVFDVYLQSTFFPRLSQLDFWQEGHRLEFEKPQDVSSELVIKGVVFNEMKGALAAPSRQLYQSLTNEIYPQTTYRYNSGGDPEHIPNLTYDQFLAFHKTHYHPSNAFIYTYGDMAITELLTFIDREALSKFTALDPKTQIPDELVISQAKHIKAVYDIEEGEDDGAKNYLVIGWLTCHNFEVLDYLSLGLLSDILMGNDGSPLKKVLLESGLGKSLSDLSGFHAENRQTKFVVGLDGIQEKDLLATEELILTTLKTIQKNGIPKSDIDSAMHRFKFSRLEITGGYTPYSLHLMFNVIGPWLHGADPVDFLRVGDNIAMMEKALASDPLFLEKVMNKYLIENQHRVTVNMQPDYGLGQEKVAREKAFLLDKMAKMSATQKAEVVRNYVALKEHQNKQDDFSCIPKINKTDLKREISQILSPPVAGDFAGVPYGFYQQVTNGITYIRLYFNIDHLTTEELAQVPIICELLTQNRTQTSSYDRLAQEMARYTGGISCSPYLASPYGAEDQVVPHIIVEGRAFEENVPKLIDIMQEILTTWDYSDHPRIKTVLRQIFSQSQEDITEIGHDYARRLASRYFSPATYLSEILFGIHQLQNLHRLDSKTESDLVSDIDGFVQTTQKLFSQSKMTIHICSDQPDCRPWTPRLDVFAGSFAEKETGCAFVHQVPSSMFVQEAWTTTTPVSFVVKGFKVPTYHASEASKFLVLQNLIEMNFIHPEVREKGGAYGGMVWYFSRLGVFYFMSYRDPNLRSTLNTYDQVVDWLNKETVGQPEVDQAIINTIAMLDRPTTPYGKTKVDWTYRLEGFSPPERQKLRDGILNCSWEELKLIANTWLTKDASTAVVTSAQKAKEEGADLKAIPILHEG